MNVSSNVAGSKDFECIPTKQFRYSIRIKIGHVKNLSVFLSELDRKDIAVPINHFSSHIPRKQAVYRPPDRRDIIPELTKKINFRTTCHLNQGRLQTYLVIVNEYETFTFERS